jgi:hypothetical protein
MQQRNYGGEEKKWEENGGEIVFSSSKNDEKTIARRCLQLKKKNGNYLLCKTVAA